MKEQQLFFNLLTLDWPRTAVDFYFSRHASRRSCKLSSSHFPRAIGSLFPELAGEGHQALFTTFTRPAKDFQRLPIHFEKENPALVKGYYCHLISHYFSDVNPQLNRSFFSSHQNQVWIRELQDEEGEFDCYNKFLITVRLAELSFFPELVISWEGQAFISKHSLAQGVQAIDPEWLTLVRYQGRLVSWQKLSATGLHDLSCCFAVMNRKIMTCLELPAIPSAGKPDFIRFFNAIQGFYADHLNTDAFKEIIPLHKKGFQNVDPGRVHLVSAECQQLLFGNNQTGLLPDRFHQLKPYRQCPYPHIDVFYVFHERDLDLVREINSRLIEGYGLFTGMVHYTGMLLRVKEEMNIIFHNDDDPIEEIANALWNSKLDPKAKYLAIYITPHSKERASEEKQQIYFNFKELFLKYKISSQVIDPVKMSQQGLQWQHSLANLAVGILTKLGGVPWRLKTTKRNQLVMGIGVHFTRDNQPASISSVFFDCHGRVIDVETFFDPDQDMLLSAVKKAIRKYLATSQLPEHLVIHINHPVAQPVIDAALKELERELAVRVHIILVKRTCFSSPTAFDKQFKHLIPVNGTFVHLGGTRYLLFNNTRLAGQDPLHQEHCLFPILLSIHSLDPETGPQSEITRSLIEQVYQYSTISWSAISRQSLPVSIRYAEVVAQLAGRFAEKCMPEYAREGNWLL